MEINKNSSREIVLEAVKQEGWALLYASDDLKADREIVLAAIQLRVRSACFVLQFASDELKADPELIKISKQSG